MFWKNFPQKQFFDSFCENLFFDGKHVFQGTKKGSPSEVQNPCKNDGFCIKILWNHKISKICFCEKFSFMIRNTFIFYLTHFKAIPEELHAKNMDFFEDLQDIPGFFHPQSYRATESATRPHTKYRFLSFLINQIQAYKERLCFQ